MYHPMANTPNISMTIFNERPLTVDPSSSSYVLHGSPRQSVPEVLITGGGASPQGAVSDISYGAKTSTLTESTPQRATSDT